MVGTTCSLVTDSGPYREYQYRHSSNLTRLPLQKNWMGMTGVGWLTVTCSKKCKGNVLSSKIDEKDVNLLEDFDKMCNFVR